MSEVRQLHNGRLKIYLSYAAGAGKTYRMLEDAQQARRKGMDVAVGYFEPHERKDTIAKLEGLELIPRRSMEYRDKRFEELDVEAILLRSPAICLVDEFAHSNAPGSRRTKRWEDVLELLNTGIRVFMSETVTYLFYKDTETIERFVEEITTTRNTKDLVPLLHRFGAYLDTLLGQVALRTVLAGEPLAH